MVGEARGGRNIVGGIVVAGTVIVILDLTKGELRKRIVESCRNARVVLITSDSRCLKPEAEITQGTLQANTDERLLCVLNQSEMQVVAADITAQLQEGR